MIIRNTYLFCISMYFFLTLSDPSQTVYVRTCSDRLTKMVLTLVLQELWPILSNSFCMSSLQINPIYSCQLFNQFSNRPFTVPPYQFNYCLLSAGRLHDSSPQFWMKGAIDKLIILYLLTISVFFQNGKMSFFSSLSPNKRGLFPVIDVHFLLLDGKGYSLTTTLKAFLRLELLGCSYVSCLP